MKKGTPAGVMMGESIGPCGVFCREPGSPVLIRDYHHGGDLTLAETYDVQCPPLQNTNT